MLNKNKVSAPISVKFVELKKEKKEELNFKKGAIIEIPKPDKMEEPTNHDSLSEYSSRAHGGKNISKKVKYKSIKNVAPKNRHNPETAIEKQTVNKANSAKKNNNILKKKNQKAAIVARNGPEQKEPLNKTKKPMALAGLFINQEKIMKNSNKNKSSLFNGFDPEKFAQLDTGDRTYESDTETISLDSQEFKYASYFASIKRQIEMAWSYPEKAAINGLRGELLLQFVLNKSGQLLDIMLISSAGHKILDAAALDAVMTAAPYNPFPARIDKKKLRIIATFTYKPFYTAYK